MPVICSRKTMETGNPLVGYLNNDDGTLTIPSDAAVTLDAWRTDSSAQVITNGAVTVVDRAARLVSYAWADADLAVGLAGVTLAVEWTITAADGKKTVVPDREGREILVPILARGHVGS